MCVEPGPKSIKEKKNIMKRTQLKDSSSRKKIRVK
jgi:hypothetical protein